jgi:hypothetical protein
MSFKTTAIIRSVRGLLSEASVESQNKEHGFYGQIMRSHPKVVNLSRDAANKLFSAFVSHIASKFGIKPEQASDYLDSSYGRHLGDQISASGVTDVKSLPDSIQTELAKTVRKFKLSSDLRGPRAGLTGFSNREREPERSQSAFRYDPQSGVRESVEDFASWFAANKDSDELKDDYDEFVHDSRDCPEIMCSFKKWAKGIWQSLRESVKLGETNMSYCVFENTYRDVCQACGKLEDINSGNLHLSELSKYEIEGLHNLADKAKKFVELYGEGDYPHEADAKHDHEEQEDLAHL